MLLFLTGMNSFVRYKTNIANINLVAFDQPNYNNFSWAFKCFQMR